MGKHLLLVGGGHAHMTTLANLSDLVDMGHRVTVVGPSEHHYYSGMGPGMLGGTYAPSEIRFATRQVVEKHGGTFVLGKAVRVDPGEKQVELESGETLGYDVVSFNVGSYVPRLDAPEEAEDVYPVKPIEKLMEARERIEALAAQKPATIGILGGGPSSAEIAGNVWQLTSGPGKHRPRIQIFAGKGLMTRFPEGVRTRVERILRDRGVEIHTGYVQRVDPGGVVLESGTRFELDFTFLALGVKPNPVFERSGIPTGPDGGLRVNACLQGTAHPDMFGGGDCIYFQDRPLDKVGVYAVRQNPVLYNNLRAALEGGPLQTFNPGGDYLLIFNMGGGQGVLRKKGLTFDGKPAFLIKNYIDRKFMKRFQSIE
jgi:NADH dehydrogenase FAD-containing subunit